MFSHTEENYIKAIYKLSGETPGTVTTNEIAGEMQTKPATVTDMLKKLAEKKIINYEKYQGVKLTRKGASIALKTIRKHRLWEVFLVEKLNFSWDEVHEVAEQLEHIHSEKLIEMLDKFLDHPKTDPHGDPIPDEDGGYRSIPSKTLSEFSESRNCCVCGVREDSTAFFNHLKKMKLDMGTKIIIMEKNEFDHSVTIRLGKDQVIISNEVAKNILVK